MNLAFVKAAIAPVPFAVAEWSLIAFYFLYWHRRRSSFLRGVMQVILCVCPLGFLLFELRIRPTIFAFDQTAIYIYYCEAFGTLVVSAILFFIFIMIIESKSQEPSLNENTAHNNQLPAVPILAFSGKVLLAILITGGCYYMLPTGFIREHSFAVSAVSGPMIVAILKLLDATIGRKRKSGL